MLSTSRLLFSLIAAIGVATAVYADDEPSPRRAANFAGDEQFLLKMREQLGSTAPHGSFTAGPEQQLEWFKNGLRQAAAEQRPPGPEAQASGPQPWGPPHAPPQNAYGEWPTSQPPHLPPPLAHQPPPAWRALLESAMQLERIAHGLDQQQLWSASDKVREAAASLRDQARESLSDRVPGPSH